MNDKPNVSRRDLLGIAGAAAVTIAGATLSACSPSESASTTESTPATPAPTATSTTEAPAQVPASPDVFMTTAISADGLQRVYDALKFTPTGKVAIKLSTGEAGSNFLRPELVGGLVKRLSGTIVECNTAYAGDRDNTESHLRIAEANGFTAIADVDIMDADGQMSLPVTGGTVLQEDLVGDHYSRYESWVSLAHFKGHAMAGFGGAMKNCSIGIASAAGKALIHSAGTTASGSVSWGATPEGFLEAIAEAAKAVADDLGDRIVYVNVMNRISVDCDCDTHPSEPDMADIGILASTDPVALDQACIDLVYAAPDGASVVERIESREGLRTMKHAEAIGLGSRTYNLVSLD